MRRLIAPPPRLLISEWADRYAYIPTEGNAEPGKFHISRMPWQRDMLNDPLDPNASEFVWEMAKQLGKTICLIIIIEYYMDQDPSPILVVYPTIDDGKAWSNEKFTPTIQATPRLRGRIRDARERDSGNTIRNKRFPGGNLTIAGSNSPSGLRQRSKRIILLDEIDAYEANREGDPVEQADGRSETFHNAVKGKCSTPTIKKVSRVDNLFQKSDKHYWFCPCPRCEQWQRLKWSQVKWEFEQPDGSIISNPEEAVYVCESCKEHLGDADRIDMIHAGEWRATATGTTIRGRHLSGLYRLIGKKKAFKSYLHEFVDGFLKAKSGGKWSLMVWVNTFLAEAWEDESTKIETNELLSRREDYGPELPDKVLMVTCEVDTQDDRLEVEVTGWGAGKESWGILYKVIPGRTIQPQVWRDLHNFLVESRWRDRWGVEFEIEATAIDAGGHATDMVYQFCKPRYGARVFAVVGARVHNAPLVSTARRSNRRKCPVYHIGTNTAKDTIFGQLTLPKPGSEEPCPGFMHYPSDDAYGFTQVYFSMLTAEEMKIVYVKGFPRREYAPTRPRNEALDMRVYGEGLIGIMQPDWAALAIRLDKKREAAESAKVKSGGGPVSSPAIKTMDAPAKRKNNWLRGYK